MPFMQPARICQDEVLFVLLLGGEGSVIGSLQPSSTQTHSALVIYCCETNYLKTQQLQTTDIYYHTVLWVRNGRVAQLCASGSWSLLRLQSGCCLGLQATKSLTGGRMYFKRVHLLDCWLEALIPCTRASPQVA